MAQDTVTIRFEGRALACRAGTSVGAALWEHGVRVLSRSPKYGRPRGLTCARGHCTACLMRVDGVPNVRACETPVREGMDVARQDAGAPYGGLMQRSLAAGDRLFPVGFYFKWFTRPALLGRLFLRVLRPLTGVGRLPAARALPAAPGAADAPAPTPAAAVDTVVVGAGVSGLRAAADLPGALVLDENDAPGGLRLQALRELAARPGGLDGFPALADAHAALEEALAAAAGAEVRRGARVVAGFAGGGLVVREGERLSTLTCRRLVWAAGALDRLGLFPGNDTPGVMGPRAVLRLLLRDGLRVAGQRALLVGGGPDLWLTAALLAARGAKVALVVTAEGQQEGIAGAVARKWPLNTGLDLASVARQGEDGLRATFTPESDEPADAAARLRLDADIMVICRGGKPAYDIAYQLGARLELQPEHGGFVAVAAPAGLDFEAVGEAAGRAPAELLTPAREART